MIIAGAKGFAKEVLEIFNQLNTIDNIYFYDDINKFNNLCLYNKFKIVNNIEDAANIFNNIDKNFVLGIGNPLLRYKLTKKFEDIGGSISSIISPYARIGSFGNLIDGGANIMTGTVITNDITLEKGVLINLNCTIGHDSFIGRFSELCPGVHISGNCKIGEFSFIGTGSVILPGVSVGKNVIVGAGAVVTKDIGDNSMVIGAPAKKIKDLESIIL
ncbi:MAG: acetyltransferase [Bacteroidales bacterium]|nr:acetyltransferase [Bacteroidales bacterium]